MIATRKKGSGMLRKFLVGYDGSKQAEKAFALGLETAAKFGATLIAASIFRLPEPAAEGSSAP